MRKYFRGVAFFVTLFTSLLQADLECSGDSHVSAVAETNSITQTSLRATPTPLIVACYNVENYLTMPRWINGRFRTSAGKPETQKQAIATILATLHPDIIGLMEIGDLRQVHDLERHLHHVGLDYPYSEYLQGWDKERHLLLLSRFPLVERHSQAMIPLLVNGKTEHSPRGIIDVTLEPKPNVRLRLIALHFKSKIPVPDYDQAAFRAAEAHYLKSYVQRIMREDPKTYLLVMGDCNDTKNSKPLFTLLGNSKKPGLLQALDLRDDRKESWTQYWKEADEYSRIDYMMVNTRLAPFIIHEHSGIARPASWREASDHCPLFSEILFQQNASLELPPALSE